MKKAIVFMADGMEMCECLIVVDLLRRAGIEVTTASVMGRTEIRSSHGVMISADVLAEDADYESADMIILPGGTVGTAHLASSGVVKEQCLKFNPDKYIAAICAAPTVLAGLGLLENRRATCHPGVEENMEGALLTHSGVSVDHNIITGRALGASFDFGLRLAEILEGPEAVDKVRHGICYEKQV